LSNRFFSPKKLGGGPEIAFHSPHPQTASHAACFSFSVEKEEVWGRVARFFLVTMYQNGRKYTKLPLNYQMAVIYSK
jgi:hypothetical protein